MSEINVRALLAEFFAEEAIELYEALDLADCPVTRKDLLDRTLPGARTVILYAVPYFIGRQEGANLSLYAMAPDYHLYLRALGARLKDALLPLFPDARFEAFGDHSPIDERISAARAGFGVLGDNGLIITKKYGSFIFIGELLSDLPPEALGASPAREVCGCLHCGACKRACPCRFEDCASGIGQKKGDLTPEEEELVLKTGLVWGCDLCQTACPLNKRAKETPVPFFRSDLITRLDRAAVEGMDKKALRARAFGWRGRAPLLRNVELFERKEKEAKNAGGTAYTSKEEPQGEGS